MANRTGEKNIEDLQYLPEGRLLLRIALPIIASLLVQGLYSFVDSVFLSRLGEQALSAVSLSLVMQSFSAAFFAGIATGMNALLSRALGRGDPDGAKTAALSGIGIQLVFVAAFTLFGAFGTRVYFAGTTQDEAVIRLGMRYLVPCMLCVACPAAQVTFERILQASGITKYVLYAQAAGTVVNLVLDPILIFGWLGAPALGVAGAAYATVLGQLCAALLALLFNIRHNRRVFDGLFRKRHLQGRMMLEVLKIGIPTAMMGIGSSLGNYFINRILIGFSATANAAFGVYTKLQSIAVMPVQGVAMAMVTLLSFFYGKRSFPRFRKTLIAGERMLAAWGAFCLLAFTLVPRQMMAIFEPSEQMLRIGIPAFRLIGTTYLVSSMMTGLNSFFQATGKSLFPLFVSLSRQVLVRIPTAYWLASYGVISRIWWCWPISEVVSDLVCLILFIYAYRQFKRKFDQITTETEKTICNTEPSEQNTSMT